MTAFRRFSKRRQRVAMLVALLDRAEWGPPQPLGPETRAAQRGVCVGCGAPIGRGERIVSARYGPPDENRQTWVHARCPDPWGVLATTVERYDRQIIVKINPQGRGRASCGHDVTNEPVYLLRRPVSLATPNSSAWVCEPCAAPGGDDS